MWDHLYPTLGTGSLEGPNIEATVALTSLAMVTERVRIGCLVFSTSMRNPANYWQRGLRVYDGISGRRHGGHLLGPVNEVISQVAAYRDAGVERLKELI